MNGIVNGRGNGWPGKQGAWRVFLLLVLLSQTIMGCQAEEAGQEPVAVEVMRVGFDRTTDMPVVILRDKGRNAGDSHLDRALRGAGHRHGARG